MKTEKLFEKYGRRVKLTINRDGVHNEYSYKAFVQPLRYKNKLYLRGKFTEIGKNKQDYYLYIGPPKYDISSVDAIADHLSFDGTEYLVYRTEKHNASGEDVYIWAIIRPVSDDSEDFSQEGGEAVG